MRVTKAAWLKFSPFFLFWCAGNLKRAGERKISQTNHSWKKDSLQWAFVPAGYTSWDEIQKCRQSQTLKEGINSSSPFIVKHCLQKPTLTKNLFWPPQKNWSIHPYDCIQLFSKILSFDSQIIEKIVFFNYGIQTIVSFNPINPIHLTKSKQVYIIYRLLCSFCPRKKKEFVIHTRIRGDLVSLQVSIQTKLLTDWLTTSKYVYKW